MRRVLVFCGDRGIPALGPSGASHHLRAIGRAWRRRGARVHLATPLRADHRGVHGTLDDLDWTGCAPRRWRVLGPWRERGETWDARRLAALAAARFAPDLIWERHALFVDAGMRLAAERGLPRLVELNAPLSRERPGIRAPRYARRLERASLRAADRVCAVSPWLVDWAVRELGCDPARVRLLPNGSEVRPGDRDRGRHRLGVDGPVALWLGSCKPWHRLDRLAALADHLPGWTLAVAGTGPSPPPDHPRILRLGRVCGPALDDLLAAADVGLDLGDPHHTPWVCPLKLADYRAAGLPVLSTRPAADPHPDPAVHRLARWSAPAAARALEALRHAPRRPRPRSWDRVLDEAVAGMGRPPHRDRAAPPRAEGFAGTPAVD